MSNTQSISAKQSIAYALPVVTTAWLITPMGIIQGLYAKLYAIPLAEIAMIILIARLFDAITDPLIGYFADRHLAKTGTVKPFLWAGGLLFIVSSYFLYIPVVEVTTSYLLICFLLIYLAWTLFEIPHLAWANALAPTSEGKTRIFSYRAVAAYAGILFFYGIPLLPFFETQDITQATLKVSVLIADVLMLIFLFISLSKTPGHLKGTSEEKILGNQSGPGTIHSENHFKQTLFFLKHNKPLMLFISAYSLISVSAAMWYGLIFIYVDSYLNMGEKFAKMSLLSFVVGVLVVPLWYRLTVFWGKRQALLAGISLLASSFAYTVFLNPHNASFLALLSLSVILAVGMTGMSAVLPSMLAEVADYGVWKTHINRTNTCFALFTFGNKACNAIGTSLALSVAGWYGFKVTSSLHADTHISGLHMAISWLPLLLISVAAILVCFSPINACRHRIIRKALDRRATPLTTL